MSILRSADRPSLPAAALGSRRRRLQLSTIGSAIAVVTAAAAALRFWDLTSIPPGFSFDEAANVLDALAILNDGFRPIFVDNTLYGTAREGVHLYLHALILRLLGDDQPQVIRYVSALMGTLSVPLIYLAAREMFSTSMAGKRVKLLGLAAATLTAFSYWHLHESRLGLRAIFLVPVELVVLYFMWRAIRRNSPAASFLCGTFLSASLLTYLAARALPVAIMPVYCIGVFASQLPVRRKLLHAGVFVLGLAIASMPFVYASIVQTEAVWFRAQGILIQADQGLAPILKSLIDTAAMFSVSGDSAAQYNFPWRPVFRFPLDLFFYAGLVLALLSLSRRLRQKCLPAEGESTSLPALSLLLLLLVMLAPTYLAIGAPHFLRAVGAFVPAILLAALGLVWVFDGALRRGHQLLLAGAGALISIAVIWNAVSTVYDYFVVFPTRTDTYYFFDNGFIRPLEDVKLQAANRRVFVDPALLRHGTARLYLRNTPVTELDPGFGAILPKDDAEYYWMTMNKNIDEFAALAGDAATRAEPIRDARAKEVLIHFTSPGAVNLSPLSGHASSPLGGPIMFQPGFDLEAFTWRSEGRWLEGEALIPGHEAKLVLEWKVRNDIAEDYAVSVRLVDSRGRTTVQRDSAPAEGSLPTSRWRAGDTVIDAHLINVPLSVPPGGYRVEIEVYDPSRGASVGHSANGVATRGLIQLGNILIGLASPATAATFAPPVVLSNIEHLGLTLIGRDAASSSQIVPGQALDVGLFWRNTRFLSEEVTVQITLTDQTGRIAGYLDERPVDGSFSTSSMVVGQLLPDVHRLAVSRAAAPGLTTLDVSLHYTSSPALAVAQFPGPEVKERQHLYEAPAMPEQLGALFGGELRLVGYRVDVESAGRPGQSGQLPRSARVGDNLRFSFVWQAVREPSLAYTVFLQLLNGEGKLVSQEDALPLGGTVPTDAWLANEVFSDEHVLPLPAGLPPGDYSIIVGFYDAKTGQRLAVGDSDYLRLGELDLAG